MDDKLKQERIDKELKFKRDLEKLNSSPVKAEGYVNPLNNDIIRVKAGDTNNLTEPLTKVRNVTDKIDTKGIQKTISGDDFMEKIANARAAKQALKTGGKKVLGAVPFIGGALQALATQDASAAVPLLGDADSVGENDADLHAERAYQVSPAGMDAAAARLEALKKLGR